MEPGRGRARIAGALRRRSVVKPLSKVKGRVTSAYTRGCSRVRNVVRRRPPGDRELLQQGPLAPQTPHFDARDRKQRADECGRCLDWRRRHEDPAVCGEVQGASGNHWQRHRESTTGHTRRLPSAAT